MNIDILTEIFEYHSVLTLQSLILYISPTPYNYTAPVQDSVGTFNGATGPSYIPFVEGEYVEVVLQNTLPLNKKPDMHSWHLHGHGFWVVGRGSGNFDENTDPASYNLVNPVRRDTATLLPYGWTVIRVRLCNSSNHIH